MKRLTKETKNILHLNYAWDLKCCVFILRYVILNKSALNSKSPIVPSSALGLCSLCTNKINIMYLHVQIKVLGENKQKQKNNRGLHLPCYSVILLMLCNFAKYLFHHNFYFYLVTFKT